MLSLNVIKNLSNDGDLTDKVKLKSVKGSPMAGALMQSSRANNRKVFPKM